MEPRTPTQDLEVALGVALLIALWLVSGSAGWAQSVKKQHPERTVAQMQALTASGCKGCVYRVNNGNTATDCDTTGGGAYTPLCESKTTDGLSWSWTAIVDTSLSGSAAGGDLTGTYPNPSVTDDSHAHTTTTVSGLVEADIIDLAHTATDLAAGAIDQTTDFDASMCLSGQILERGGAVWGCIATPTGITDHGALTGLTDDDHTQYVLGAGDTMTGQLVLATGSSSLPELALGGLTDSGWSGYAGGGYISAIVDGAPKWHIHGSNYSFWSAGSGGPSITQDSVTLTNPAFMMRRGDADTGVGGDGVANHGALIAGGVTVLDWINNGTSNIVRLSNKAGTQVLASFHQEPMASAPSACVIGDSYTDTSGAYCDCTSTNTWSARHGGACA